MNFFKDKFEKLLKTPDWATNEDYKSVIGLFIEKQEENEEILISYLEKYKLSKGDEYLGFFYKVILFIKYLGKEKNFTNKKIITLLKEELDCQLSVDKPRYYAYILMTLFEINKDKSEKSYYIEQFNNVIKQGKLFHDINGEFMDIFIHYKYNQKFIDSFKKGIIDNNIHILSSDVEKGFKYLNSLKNNIFKKYLFELLDYFGDEALKTKLIHLNEYTSFIRDENRSIKEVIDELFEKINQYNFSDYENEKLANFLYGDISFALKNFERNLDRFYFIKKLSDYIFTKNKSFIIDFIKNFDLINHHLYGAEKYVLKYIQKGDIDKLIDLLFGNDKNHSFIFYLYDLSNKEQQKVFEDNIKIGKDIKDRNKRIVETNKEYEKERKEKLKKEKKEFLGMLKPEINHYYPKIFQDYLYYVDNKTLEKIYKKKEIEEINKTIRVQAITFFEIIKVDNYSKDRLGLVHFQKTGDSTFHISSQVQILSLVLDVCSVLSIDIKKYYKSIILFYPLIYGDSTFKLIKELIAKIDDEDIDYLLKAYSEDLHENAIGLRFHNPENLIRFDKEFFPKYNNKQKKLLSKICFDFLKSDVNLYLKESFLEIIGKVEGKKSLLKLWDDNYVDFNYFKDVLKNEKGLEKEQINKLKFLVSINKILIEKFKYKESILWRIEQIKNGVVECRETGRIEYPNTSMSFSGFSELESEIGRFFNDSRTFLGVFSNIQKVDVKKEMLTLLKLSFDIQKEIIDGKKSEDYELYYNYIRKVFFTYVENLDVSLRNKDYYYKVKNLLSKLDDKIKYGFDLERLKKVFGIDDLDEEAKKIYEKGEKAILELLKERDYLLNNSNTFVKEEKNIINGTAYKCILFVEGRTDIIILENAWEKLYGKKVKQFRIENGFDRYHIGRGFKEDHYGFLDSDPNLIMIGMLDYYSAFEQQKKLLDIDNKWNIKQDIDSAGRLLKHPQKDGYVFLLPVPEYRKEYAKLEYREKSLLSIELLFKDELLNGFTDEIEIPGGIKMNKMNKDKKMNFALKTNNFNKVDFEEGFKPIFELIEKIIKGEFK